MIKRAELNALETTLGLHKEPLKIFQGLQTTVIVCAINLLDIPLCLYDSYIN